MMFYQKNKKKNKIKNTVLFYLNISQMVIDLPKEKKNRL